MLTVNYTEIVTTHRRHKVGIAVYEQVTKRAVFGAIDVKYSPYSVTEP